MVILFSKRMYYKLSVESLYVCNETIFWVMLLDVKLLVDGEEIDLSEFVVKILSGALVGAVTSLRGIKEDWKEIELKVTKIERSFEVE